MNRPARNNPSFRTAAALLAGFSICAALGASAQAGTLSSWSGATNGNWGTSTNWSPTAVNTTGTFSLVFGGTTRNSTTNNLGTVNIDLLSFTNNGSSGRNQGFTIGSGTLNLVSGTVLSAQVTTGTLSNTITSRVQITGTSLFNLGDRNNLVVSGPIAGGDLVKTGLGQLSLTGSVSLNSISIQRGNLLVNSTAYRGLAGKIVDIGSTSFNSGALVFNSIPSGTSNMQFRFNDNSILSTQGSNNVVFSNPNFNVATSSTNVLLTLNGGVSSFSTMTINGAIQDNTGGSLGVSIAQGNTWVLNGANTYTGPTTVASPAKLLVNGGINAGSTTTVAGYLGGSGTFGGAVSMISSGTLSPGGVSTSGVVTDTIGRLTMASLSLGSGVTSQFTVSGLNAGVDFDQIVGSSVTYGGNLALTLTGTQAYAKDTIFNLFKDFSTRTGNFSSVTLSAAGTPYNGLVFSNLGGGIWETGSTGFPLGEALRFEESTGNLVVVPEPSTFVLAGLGVMIAGAQVWRRRRATAA